MGDKSSILRQLPSVDQLLRNRKFIDLGEEFEHSLFIEAIRNVLQELREEVLAGEVDEENFRDYFSIENIFRGVSEKLHKIYSPNLREVINGTGVVIHTNLGRAPIAESIARDLTRLSTRYVNLEYDLEDGGRGSRHDVVRDLLCRITGAEDGIVVNNNAAAVLLVLSALAKGKEVIVSRGQLVEIGGSFRVPEVMEQGGARLVEVGTTNKTYIQDFERAICDDTALLLKVHTSNYRILGFTREVTLDEMVELGRSYNLPVVEDLGSGVLVDLSKYGLGYEPTVQQSIKAGADIVTFSGDKLLGGPQAGFIVGRGEYIRKIARHPLARAVRIDKLTLAALEGTLREYLDPKKVIERVPVLRMLTLPVEELERKANKLASMLIEFQSYCQIQVEKGYSQVGGGSLPLEEIETRLISIIPKFTSVNCMDERLRNSDLPVVGRISKDRFLIDVRTVFEDQFSILAARLKEVLSEGDK